jgi:hypothetical protein
MEIFLLLMTVTHNQVFSCGYYDQQDQDLTGGCLPEVLVSCMIMAWHQGIAGGGCLNVVTILLSRVKGTQNGEEIKNLNERN